MSMNQTSRSYVLDAIEGIVNLIAATSHIRENLQEIYHDYKDTGDLSLLKQIADKKETLSRINQLRRGAMSLLVDEMDGNMHEWCTTKHLAYPFVTFWESYDATQDDKWYDKAIEATDLFVDQLARFLNIDTSELGGCLRCFGDAAHIKINEITSDNFTEEQQKEISVEEMDNLRKAKPAKAISYIEQLGAKHKIPVEEIPSNIGFTGKL